MVHLFKKHTTDSAMSLSGKVALVTGGTKGIGAAIAAKFVSEGALVAVNYGSDTAAADKLVQELGGPKKVLAVQGDMSKVAEIEKVVKATVDAFGKIDILIPNAGTMPMYDLEHLTEENYDFVMNTNVKGPLFLAQVCPPLLSRYHMHHS
jgi:3-oxoacyl-[acyl-carrier protein] reductase